MRKHYQAPLHRRLLPWLFFIIFLLVAPILIFYTAGYRYNFKKNKLERNGTLLISSVPRGASVFLDGQVLHGSTPVTFQNVSPGWHTLRLEKPSYRAWEKSVEVRSEQVTFAEDIQLWKNTEPSLVLAGNFPILSANPSGETLALLRQTTSSRSMDFWSPTLTRPISHSIPLPPSWTPPLRWREDGQALLIGGLSLQHESWWIPVTQRATAPQALPAATYQWSGNDLIGSNGLVNIRLNTATQSLTRTPLQPPMIASNDRFDLKTNTSSHDLILTDRGFFTRTIDLPKGAWNFAEQKGSYVLLHAEPAWLALNTRLIDPLFGKLEGDTPRWLPGTPLTALLLNDQREVWLWKIVNEPVLLWRQSEPIQEVEWQQTGKNVFIADQHHVFALSLDNDRLATSLVDFDQISDIAVLNKALFISGIKEGKTGLWKLEVE